MKDYFVHPSAFVDEGARIGEGTKIWHNAHVMPMARIGNNCVVAQNCFVAGVVGNGCKLQNNVNVYEGVKLEDFVFCGPSMTFTNDINPRSKYPKNKKFVETKVLEGATLGANCVVVCGVKIGKWSLVGAGAVVTKDVPDYAIVVGTPARVHGWICECGEKLPNEFATTECKKCSKKYKKKDLSVREIK